MTTVIILTNVHLDDTAIR